MKASCSATSIAPAGVQSQVDSFLPARAIEDRRAVCCESETRSRRFSSTLRVRDVDRRRRDLPRARPLASDSRKRHLDVLPCTDLETAAPPAEVLPALERLDDRCLLSGLTPAQVTSAYGLDAMTFTSPTGSAVHGDGSGQTIALIEAYHDPTIASDLRAFDQAYGLPDPTLTVDNLAGKKSDDGWALEEALDVEWAHAVAPGAHILVVEASSQSLKALLVAVNVARNTPGVVAVSMSWGSAEFRKESAYNSRFTTPSGHSGVTFLAASGDSGSFGGPEWPSVAPTVVAVGGTSLYFDTAGQNQFEKPWVGSSGGYSRFETEPAYQRSVQRTGRRSSPDVSFDGDPNTGVSVYETAPSTGRGSWVPSSAGPAWVRRHGRASSPSSTRAERSRARAAWTERRRPYQFFMVFPQKGLTPLASSGEASSSRQPPPPTHPRGWEHPTASTWSPAWSRAT